MVLCCAVLWGRCGRKPWVCCGFHAFLCIVLVHHDGLMSGMRVCVRVCLAEDGGVKPPSAVHTGRRVSISSDMIKKKDKRAGKPPGSPADEVDEAIAGEVVSEEEDEFFDNDAADIRSALTEAFVAKTKQQRAVLATGSGTDSALVTLDEDEMKEVEKPDDCKAQ